MRVFYCRGMWQAEMQDSVGEIGYMEFITKPTQRQLRQWRKAVRKITL